MVEELPPHYSARASRTALELTWGGRPWRQSGTTACGILSKAKVAWSSPATAPLPSVGIQGATQAIGGRGGTLPRRHPEAGGDHHPVPGPGQ